MRGLKRQVAWSPLIFRPSIFELKPASGSNLMTSMYPQYIYIEQRPEPSIAEAIDHLSPLLDIEYPVTSKENDRFVGRKCRTFS